MGVAFDGDFDRCFFFDENGRFIPGEYIIGMFSKVFSKKEKQAKVVYEPRVVFNTLDAISSSGAIPVKSRTGHAFMKNSMRNSNAIYGGEISAHHYFRDFAYCDSGMIPLLLMLEYLSGQEKVMSRLVEKRKEKFLSSGEINFQMRDKNIIFSKIEKHFHSRVKSKDFTDGLSFEFDDWRFNLRASNTSL